jgi:hypothetical protein
MVRHLVAALLASLLSPAFCLAQLAQLPASPVPLYPGTAPRSIEAEPLPPIAPAPETALPPAATPPVGLAPPPAASSAGAAPVAPMEPPAGAPMAAPAATPGTEPTGRVFCEQPVTVQLADPGAVPERFRPFVGIWSDASWTPQLCAALIVERVTPDGTAAIVYVFGPMSANPRGPRGILHGTGIIRDGELRFQNSDGSQFAFQQLYADLGGRLSTPQGQHYEAVFKKTP